MVEPGIDITFILHLPCHLLSRQSRKNVSQLIFFYLFIFYRSLLIHTEDSRIYSFGIVTLRVNDHSNFVKTKNGLSAKVHAAFVKLRQNVNSCLK